jgi:hypothetical protein
VDNDNDNEDYDRIEINDNKSVYSRRVIKNSGRDMNTNSINRIKTRKLSVFSVKMDNKKISVPNEQNKIVIDKNGNILYVNSMRTGIT